MCVRLDLSDNKPIRRPRSDDESDQHSTDDLASNPSRKEGINVEIVHGRTDFRASGGRMRVSGGRADCNALLEITPGKPAE